MQRRDIVVKSVLHNKYLLRYITKYFYLYDNLDQHNSFDHFIATLNLNQISDTPSSSTSSSSSSSQSQSSSSPSQPLPSLQPTLLCRDLQVFKYKDINDLNWVCENHYFSLLLYKLEESQRKRSSSSSQQSNEIVLKDSSIAIVCRYVSDLSMITKIANILSFRMFTQAAYIASSMNENTLVFQYIEKSWIQYSLDITIRRDAVSLALCGALQLPNLTTIQRIITRHSQLLNGSRDVKLINNQLLNPDINQFHLFINNNNNNNNNNIENYNSNDILSSSSSTLKDYFKKYYINCVKIITIESFKLLVHNQLLDNLVESYQFNGALIQYSDVILNQLYNQLILNNHNNNDPSSSSSSTNTTTIQHSDITILHYVYFNNYCQKELIDNPSKYDLNSIIDYIYTPSPSSSSSPSQNNIKLTETQEKIALLAEIISRIPGLYGYRYAKKKDIKDSEIQLPEKMIMLMLSAESNHLIDLLLENSLVYPSKDVVGNRGDPIHRRRIEQQIMSLAIRYAKPQQMEYLQQCFSSFFTSIETFSQQFSQLLSLSCDHHNLPLVSFLLKKAGLEPISNFNITNIVLKLMEYNIHLLTVFRLVERLYFVAFVNRQPIRNSLRLVISHLLEKCGPEQERVAKKIALDYLNLLLNSMMSMACYFGRIEVVQLIHSIHPDAFTSYIGMVMDCTIRGGIYRVDEIMEFFKTSNRYDFVTLPSWSLLGRIGRVELLESIILHVKNPASMNLHVCLESAIVNGKIDIVKYIHQQFPTQYNNNIALAIEYGHLNIVQFMVDQGYKSDRLDLKIPKIEQLAIKYSRMEIYEYIIKKSIQESKQNNNNKNVNINSNSNNNNNNNIKDKDNNKKKKEKMKKKKHNRK